MKGRKMILTHEEAKRLRDDYMADPFELIREVEEAVLNKLSQGVEMPEPVANVSASSNGCIGFVKPDKNYYTADQLRAYGVTCSAAARLKALEEAAQAASPEDSCQDEWIKADTRRRIRALKGAA